MKHFYYIVIFAFIFTSGSKYLWGQLLLENYYTIPLDTSSVNALFTKIESMKNMDSNLIYANTALNISEKIDYKKGVSDALHYIAISHYFIADYEKAIFYLEKELEILKKNNSFGDQNIIGENYRMKGEILRARKDYKAGLEELGKAEKIFLNTNNSLLLAKTYNRFAAVLLEMVGYVEDSRIPFYLEKSDSISKANNYSTILSNNLNIYATYSLNFQDYREAVEIFKQAVKYFSTTEFASEVPNIYRNIANTYRRAGVIDSALHYAYLSYNEAKNSGINVYLFNSVVILYNIYYNDLKNNDSAIVYLQYMLEYQGLMHDSEKMLYNLQAQYKEFSAEKEKELQAQNERLLYQVIISAGMLSSLLGLAYFFYYRAKLQTKANTIINQQKEELKELNAAKDKFFSIIAHDLRNPIAAFKSIAALMYDDYKSFNDSEKVEFLRLMKESSNNLLTLLENLLTWSRSQSGKIRFEPDFHNINFIINNVIQNIKVVADTKNIKFSNTIPNDLVVYCDANLADVALRNIISNSIKFSHNNSTIYLSADKLTNYEIDFVEICIRDEGIGMTDEQISKLFSIEKNKSTEGTSGEKGSGLGMILVHEFIEKNKGSIRIESIVDAGTSIYVQLPVNKSQFSISG